jgi:DNA-binding MarR family transcriptional regulator
MTVRNRAAGIRRALAMTASGKRRPRSNTLPLFDESRFAGVIAAQAITLLRRGLRTDDDAARAFAEVLEPLDLDSRLFGVMTALARLGPMTQACLIVELNSDKSTMLRTVDDLERRGLAERQPVPGDRRARTVVLTPAGRARLAPAPR